MKIEPRLGLAPEEMFASFTKMYQDEWEKHREHVPWSEKDLAALLVPLLEVVVTAVRDGMILTMYENNERIFEALSNAGVLTVPPDASPPAAGKPRGRKKRVTDETRA